MKMQRERKRHCARNRMKGVPAATGLGHRDSDASDHIEGPWLECDSGKACDVDAATVTRESEVKVNVFIEWPGSVTVVSS